MWTKIITIRKSLLKEIIGLLLLIRTATYEYSYKKKTKKGLCE